MKDLLWGVNYELTRTLKHIFYLVLVVCWFALWYAIFGLVTGFWDLKQWNDDFYGAYFVLSLPTGFGYFIYRIMT